MKTTNKWARPLWMILALQISLSSAAFGQEQSDQQELLLAPLPELLKSEAGISIESAAQWEEIRRDEILLLFEDHVYGRIPESDVRVNYRVLKEDMEALQGSAVEKEVVMEVCCSDDTLEITMLIFLPKEQSGPVPLFLGLNFNGNHTIHPDPQITITDSWVRNNRDLGITDNRAVEASRGASSSRWPVELILSRGYGLASIYYGDIDPDFDDGFENGIQGLMDPEVPGRGPSSWGSIAAWAWGLSRAMDYFEKDTEIDEERVAVMGHSRLGKTSLWAGASDERFALVISNNSGCGGAALSRRPFGERVSNINTSFPHWFASRFHEYNDNEGALPVDQHMLMALMAPRPLYVASAEEDDWADQPGEYLSLYHGSNTYKLYDTGISLSPKMPSLNQALISGSLGYHIRSGKHDVTSYDWEQYLGFADAQLQAVSGSGYENPVTMEWIEKRLFGTNPRLILNPRLEHHIWQELDKGDTLVTMGLELILQNADSLLHLDPLVRQMTGRRLLGVSREAIGRLTTLSLAYRFMRDQAHLERLEEELQAVCNFNNWNPSHFLDVAEMATGVALAIDWAGEWLSPEVNRLARNTLITKALKPGMLSSGDNWWITSSNNWNLVCHGGLAMAALVVFEDAPELSAAILHQAVEHIPLALEPYGPDGIYPEGVSYWFYATTYLTSLISAFETALGTDFGFTDAPGVMESAIFSQVMAGPSREYFNFFDSGLGGFQSLTHMGLLSWFAHRSDSGFSWDAYGSQLSRNLKEMNPVRGTRFYPVHFLNLAQLAGANPEAYVWPELWSGEGEEPIVIMRDGHNTPDAFFLAAKGGRAADNHGNMDAGSFVFELDGVRWSMDPGNQNYNELEQILGGGLWSSAQDSPRWSLLTKNSGGHSTLVVNGKMHLADARAPLFSGEFQDPIPLFTFDLSALYAENMKVARRTFSRIAETGLLISDKLLFSSLTSSMTWQMITGAEVQVQGEIVELHQDGKILYLRVGSEAPFEVNVISLSPPPLPYDKNIEGLKRLEIHWKRENFKGDTATLTVELDSKAF
ncbi:MAG: heparinase II/III family protein [Bacteroidales bacterium]|nr:heparinase II/III family protein [Bacteroidales bacterium]